jgi:hydroxymethylpyrimidine pyrophosphatase-like HAD family hydrolase
MTVRLVASSGSSSNGAIRRSDAARLWLALPFREDVGVRCLYVDLDSTLLGPGGALLRGADGAFSLEGVRALQACDRAGVEVVLMSGRRQSTVAENTRLFAQRAYIFEAGSCLVLDGEEHWLTGDLMPNTEAGSIHDQIEAAGAPALLLEHYAGRLEYHDPWHRNREVSHLFRGLVDATEVDALLAERGHGGLRLVDNGGVHRRSPDLVALDEVRAYHLVPRGASKSNAVALHMRARGFAPEDVIAVGDSREDMETATHVGAFWFVANAVERDPTLRDAIGGRANVRIAEASYGAGVYEAVVTTLAARGG